MELKAGSLAVTPPAMLVWAAFCLWLGAEGALMLLVCAAAHEAGHLLAIWALGGRVKQVRAGALGAVITMEWMPYLREALAAAAGPATSMLFTLLMVLLARETGAGTFHLMAGASAALGVFNLLPAYPMDGGRILYALLAHRFGCDAASRVLPIAGYASAACMAAGGIVLRRCPAGWALLTTAAVMAIHYCKNSCLGIESIE